MEVFISNKIILNNWSYDGTCLSYNDFYHIEQNRLYQKNDVSWLKHLREKTWFINNIEKDFLEMFYIITMIKNGKSF